MSFADMIKGIAIPETAPRSGDSLPMIRWYNGAKAARPNQADTPGDFYTRASNFPSGLGEPWKNDTRFENDNGGYSTETLKIAILAYRQQPFRDERDPVSNKVIPGSRQWFTKWEKGMQLYTEVLCFVEGYDGVAVWASDGLTGKAVTGKGGIIKTYELGLLAEAERVAGGQQLPLWSFWLPISTKRTADGKIAFEDTGYGSLITPPALHLPKDALDTLFVGAELLEKGARLMRQQARWAEQKRLPANVVEGVVVAPALPAPRNVPVNIDSADIEY